MTQQVKNSIKDYIERLDQANNYFKLTKEQKKERMRNIKAIINFFNNLEKNSVFSKIKTVYPMSHSNQKLRNVPLNFKK